MQTIKTKEQRLAEQNEYAQKLYSNPKNLENLNKMGGYHDLDDSSPVKQNLINTQKQSGVTPRERPEGYIPMKQPVSQNTGVSGTLNIDPNRGYTTEELDRMESVVNFQNSPQNNEKSSLLEVVSMRSVLNSNYSTPHKIGYVSGLIIFWGLILFLLLRFTGLNKYLVRFFKVLKLFIKNNSFPILLTIGSFIFLTQFFKDGYSGTEWVKVVSGTLIISLISFHFSNKK